MEKSKEDTGNKECWVWWEGVGKVFTQESHWKGIISAKSGSKSCRSLGKDCSRQAEGMASAKAL